MIVDLDVFRLIYLVMIQITTIHDIAITRSSKIGEAKNDESMYWYSDLHTCISTTMKRNDRFLMTGSDGMFFFWSGIMKDKKQNLECNQD